MTKKRYIFRSFSPSLWNAAFLLALISNMIHYTFLVFGLRNTSASMTTLLLSLSPFVMTFYANWNNPKYKIAIIPLLAILIGLLFVNAPFFHFAFNSEFLNLKYFFGLACAIIALATWAWYLVTNSQILSKHCVAPSDWVTALGTATFLLAILFGSFYLFFFRKNLHIEMHSSAFYQLLFGGLVLGIISSWMATYLWNHAAKRLSITFASQLTIFETIFGLLFIFIIQQRLPLSAEFFGIVLMLIGLFFSYRNSEAI